MKQSELKSLCREYVAGSISDAKLLSQLQMGDHMRDLLNGVCALPTTAQLRVRIEDLLPVVPDPDKKSKKKDDEPTTYMKRLYNFVNQYTGHDGNVPGWSEPEITMISKDSQPYYSFAFKKPSAARFLYDALNDHLGLEDMDEVKLDLPTRSVSVPHAQLGDLNLIPPDSAVTELL